MTCIALKFNTPDFALAMPADGEFRPLEPGEVFTLPRGAEIRVEDPAGLEVFEQRRPLNGGDALHQAVTVIWFRRGHMGVRFSSKGCETGQALVNGVICDGPVFSVLKTGEVVRVEGAERQAIRLLLPLTESR